jgi:hypothetical protein
MHPIERLRYVARSHGGDQRMLVRETADAISDLDLDPAGIVVTCRRIVERHPTSGPLWWLCASILASTDPAREAWRLTEYIESDPTPGLLANVLADGVRVCVIGWPDLVGEALIRRGEVTAIVVDSGDFGHRLSRRLSESDVQAELVPAAGIAAAVGASDLVLIDAVAAGPDGALAALGSHAAAAVAYCAEKPVWLVAGRGRRLPAGLWQGMNQRLNDAGPTWERAVEQVPLELFSAVFGHDGLVAAGAEALRGECPMTHELLRSSVM